MGVKIFLIAALVLIIGYSLGYTNFVSQSSKKVNESVMLTESSQVTCPYYANKDIPKEYFSNVFNEVMVSYPPSLIISNQEITPIREEFNPLKEPFGGEFYMISIGAYPWTESKFDVDNDQKDETILFANTAMNHTPNVAVIVEDGFIIFKVQGANIDISEVGDHNGFFLSEAVDWDTGEHKTTRYIYDGEKFAPVWFQISCATRPQSD
ncbi:MAG: hypothetical protein V1487_04395 [bacterium]